MVISVVEQGGDARARVHDLIETSLQTPEEKAKLEVRADEIFATLIDSGVVVRTEVPPAPDAPTDAAPDIDYALTVDLPEDFASISRSRRSCLPHWSCSIPRARPIPWT